MFQVPSELKPPETQQVELAEDSLIQRLYKKVFRKVWKCHIYDPKIFIVMVNIFFISCFQPNLEVYTLSVEKCKDYTTMISPKPSEINK